jgi:hypothetical protein
MEFQIVGLPVARGFVTQAPAPELVVFAIEQALEAGAFGGVGFGPAAVQITAEYLIQLAHAAAATPTQPLQFGAFGIAPLRGRIARRLAEEVGRPTHPAINP